MIQMTFATYFWEGRGSRQRAENRDTSSPCHLALLDTYTRMLFFLLNGEREKKSLSDPIVLREEDAEKAPLSRSFS